MKKLTLIALIILISTLAFSAKSGVNEIDISPESTVIMKSDNAGSYEKRAASVLQNYLRKIYGTTNGFKIVSDLKPEQYKGAIFAIGSTNITDYEDIKNLSSYSFLIRTKSKVITICGNKPIATLIGVGYFLDHFYGVRFYMPGDLFIKVPQKRNIKINENLTIIQSPATNYVMGTGFDPSFSGEQLFAEINGLIRKDWGSHEHTMSERFPSEKFAKKYPEIYPVYNGVKYFPKGPKDQNWQPDFSEPRLVDAAVESAIDYFKANPKVSYLAFSVQDGGNFTQKEKEAELPEDASNREAKMELYTRLFIRFLNKTAERVEADLIKNGIKDKKTLVYLSYSKVKLLPEEKLHPSILPITVFRIAESKILNLYDSTGKNDLFKPTEWAKVTNRIGHHDWTQGNGYLVPRIYTKAWQEYLFNLEKNQLRFEYAHLECYPNWGLDGPKYYYLSKLLWDPHINIDSLQKQFCDDMFGKASLAMQAYFSVLEELTISMNNHQLRKKMWKFPQQLYLEEEETALVKKARSYLNKALSEKLSKEERKRIDLFSKSFKFSEYLFELANNPGHVKTMEIKEFMNKNILSDPYTLYISRDKKKSENKLINILNQIEKKK